MKKELDVFLNFLKTKDLKLTAQREKILEIFLKTERHVTTEELYEIIKKKSPDIGQATVFRTLRLMCQAGIAEEVDLGDKKIRYEHKYGHKHHDHLVCTKCGRFIEVKEPEIESLQNKLCKKNNFLPQKHSMKIFGICHKCR